MIIKEYKLRRDKLFQALGNNSAAIIFSAKKHEGAFPYRQNSDFYYLTGFIEPDAIAILIPKGNKGKFILFNHANDPKKEVWDGPYLGQKGACHNLGADQAFPISMAKSLIPQLLSNRGRVYSNIDHLGNFDQRITNWLNKSAPKLPQLIDISGILHEMRLKKSKEELKTINKAVDITAMGHLRAMRKCAPKMFEFELEAEILHEFTRLGRASPAFPTIVASGINACTLHYAKNNKKLVSGELVIIDAGAEHEHYSADVSRTLPVNGKFTYKQRAIYEIVLAAQTETIRQIRPGLSWGQLQKTAEQIITAGLIEAKILNGPIETLLAQQKFKPFFMHKVGHWLGLDTHDVGDYYINSKWRTLEPGMVLTIEPGIYIRSLKMGVRIEDNILVTKSAHEVLTNKIPKNVVMIEKLMKS